LELTISEKHFISADYLKVTGEEWQKKELRHDARKQCVFCGHFVGAKVVKCTNCNEVIDPVGYRKLRASMEDQTAAAIQQGEIKDNGGSALRPAKKEKELVGA